MNQSVTRGVINNGIISIIQKIIRILDQLLLVPFFLTTWGAEYYGEWLTLSIIPSVLALADLGFGSAGSNSFVLAYASGNKQKAADINKSSFFTISISILIGIVLTIIILIIGNKSHLFEKSLIPVSDAMLAVTFIMAARLISFYSQLIEGYFRSARKAALGNLMISGQSASNIVVGICILMAGYKIVGYAISLLIVSIIFNIIYFIIGKGLIDLKGFQGHILKKDIKQISTKGLGYMMNPIWQSLYFQGGTLVIRLTLGAESVAIFNTVRTVCRSVNQLYSIINASIFPDLQYEYGRGNTQIVHRLFRIAVLFSMMIGIIGSIFLTLFGNSLYQWWTKNLLIVPAPVWIIFMFGVLFNAIWWTSVVSYRITNQPYHFATISIIATLISISSSYFLSIHYGLTGATIGAILFDIIMMFYVLPDSCHLLGMKTIDLFKHVKDDYHFLLKKIVHK